MEMTEEKNYAKKFDELREAYSKMTETLEGAKGVIVSNLTDKLKERKNVISGYTVKVKGKSGRKPDLNQFKWIDIFAEDEYGHKENFCITLCQSLLDTKTGNPHSSFGKLQFWCGLETGPGKEEGGDPHHVAQKVEICDEDSKKYGKPEVLHYFAKKASPEAIIRSLRSKVNQWNISGVYEPDASFFDMKRQDFDLDKSMNYFIGLMTKYLERKRAI